jgi:hypothetical protein
LVSSNQNIHIKLKIEQYEPHLNPGVEAGAPVICFDSPFPSRNNKSGIPNPYSVISNNCYVSNYFFEMFFMQC